MAAPQHITSRQNPHVKSAVRLRTGRERQRLGRTLIDGSREIVRAAAAGVGFGEAFICEKLCDSAESRQAIAAIESAGAERFTVSAAVYAKLAFGDRDEGVVVVAETPRRKPTDLQLPPKAMIAVLVGLEKPGNVGAILRSADAADIDAVIVADGRTDLYNPNTIRASVGTVFRDNVAEATSAEAAAWLRGLGLPIIAARPDAETLYTEIDLSAGAAIVLGSEAAGLSDDWRQSDTTAVRLPMHGVADSLNVSTTGAILFYEALRQRGER